MKKSVRLATAIVLVVGTLIPTGVASATFGFGSQGSLARLCRSIPRTLLVYGLTSEAQLPQRLVCFQERAPQATVPVGPITGLEGDTFLVGIDFRVQDGKLYGLGNAGGIYTLDTTNAQASKVGQLSAALVGTSFGVDFNPAANALRVISNTGQNLRHPFAVGPPFNGPTATDMPLNYLAAGTAPAINPALGVTGAAYTNNDLDTTTATTLFDIDSTLDQVVIQSPPNAGTLAATGKLGVDTSLRIGFDIFSSVKSGAATGNTALASLDVAGSTGLYGIDLLTGRATFKGPFPANNQVVDIAIPLNQ